MFPMCMQQRRGELCMSSVHEKKPVLIVSDDSDHTLQNVHFKKIVE